MNDLQNNIETRSMLPVGTLLQGGKYRIDRYLASGGFGNTYVVTNLYFDETFALKEFFLKDFNLRNDNMVTLSMPDKRPLFASHRDKFIKEARRLRKLHNGHIVGVHDLFEENGTAYYVMDFIKGESLKARMKRLERPLTEDEVMPLLYQVLDALESVHSEQIWHLDIKPDNIMVDESGRIYLIDFGASKQLHTVDGYTLATSMAMALTPGYAPLEQMEQNLRMCGPWTDIYALGATLYKLLTNYNIPPSTELLYGSQLSFPPTISQRMQELITWMMKPIYNQRPQSAAEVQAFLGGNKTSEETIVAEPVTIPEENTVAEPVLTNTDEEDAHQDPSDEYVDKSYISLTEPEEIINVCDVSFKMIRVDGGTFIMGSSSIFVGAFDGAHEVSLDTFHIGETQVTQELWETVMGINPSKFKGPKRPVEQVSWEDCQDFISRLNELTGRSFRLPTEAEWEYAARGGQRSNGYKYAGSNNIDDVAWYVGNSGIQTHDVGTKHANELGLYDMSGNVCEWCWDWYEGYSYSAQTNPIGPSSGSNRVNRGGSFFDNARICRVSRRNDNPPSANYSFNGLRLAE